MQDKEDSIFCMEDKIEEMDTSVKETVKHKKIQA